MCVGQEREAPALLPGNARVDPEIGDLFRSACGGAEAIAWQAAAQRPWKWRFRDVYRHTLAAACLHLEHPRGPRVTAGRRDRQLARLRMRPPPALEFHDRATPGQICGALPALEQPEDGVQVPSLGADALLVRSCEQGAPLQHRVETPGAPRERIEQLVLLGEEGGRTRKRLLEAGVEFQERRPERAQPGAGAGGIDIVRIINPAEAVRAAVRLGRSPGDIEERPHQLDSASKDTPAPDASQRPWSGPAEEP